MAGGGCRNSCGGGVRISNFADQQHVRIVAQKITDGIGKVISGLGVHLGLSNHRDIILNGILYRDHILLQQIKAPDTRIESGGLTRTSWSGEQNNAKGFVEHLLHNGNMVFIEPQLLHSHDRALHGQYTQDHVLSVRRNGGGNTEINRVV